MQNQKTIAIIPARGGSKRLPQKNVLPLSNIPLLVHSINYAKANLDIINKIFVSTDNKEIKALAIRNGVEVIDRPQSLSADTSTTVSALKHVLQNINEEVENIILLQATNPLRPKNILKEAFEKYQTSGTSSLVTVSPNHQKFGKIANQRFVPFNYEPGQRSQDLEPLFYENGLLYIVKAELIRQDIIVGANCFPFIINHPFGEIDIDTKEDFLKAEMYLKIYGTSGNNEF